MLKRALLVALVMAAIVGASAPIASADPTNAKNPQFITAICGGEEVSVVVNGNGTFTPGHVVGGTGMFIPIAFDLTFAFTPAGGTTMIDTETASRSVAPRPTVTCDIPEGLNTFTFPEGAFSISGTVTGFFTPAR